MYAIKELNPLSFNKDFMKRVKKDKFLKEHNHLGTDEELSKVWDHFNKK